MSDSTSTSRKPLLSVIIGMPGDNSEALLGVLKSIAAQSIAGRIEVIISAASRAMVRLPCDELREFASLRIIEIGPFQTFAEGIVPGIFEARADIVVLWEDHAFAAPGWAEAVVAAHADGCAAVGPSMENANPWTGRSWTHLLYDYGRFIRGEPGGEKEDLPGHNSSYLRSVLATYPRDHLRELLTTCDLNADLREGGHRLFLSRDAVCWHQNPSKFLASIYVRLAAHRHRAGIRAETEHWSIARRAIYALLWPIVSLIRIYDVWTNIRRQNRRDLLAPRIVAAVAFFAIPSGIGECIGFLFGHGNILASLAKFEFARHRQMCRGDLAHAPVGGARVAHAFAEDAAAMPPAQAQVAT